MLNSSQPSKVWMMKMFSRMWMILPRIFRKRKSRSRSQRSPRDSEHPKERGDRGANRNHSKSEWIDKFFTNFSLYFDLFSGFHVTCVESITVKETSNSKYRYFLRRRYKMPLYPELYKCNSRESTFVMFCIYGINLYVENNFIDSLWVLKNLLYIGALISAIKNGESIYSHFQNSTGI